MGLKYEDPSPKLQYLNEQNSRFSDSIARRYITNERQHLIPFVYEKSFCIKVHFPSFLFPQRPKLIENLPNPGESESKLLEIE